MIPTLLEAKDILPFSDKQAIFIDFLYGNAGNVIDIIDAILNNTLGVVGVI